MRGLHAPGEAAGEHTCGGGAEQKRRAPGRQDAEQEETQASADITEKGEELKEELDAAASRHPEVPYQPTLIDATYAGLISGVADMPLVIPALNRDGDCLSDLVLQMFGSIAGAESLLIALDEDENPQTVMAEAPHGTAPSRARSSTR